MTGRIDIFGPVPGDATPVVAITEVSTGAIVGTGVSKRTTPTHVVATWIGGIQRMRCGLSWPEGVGKLDLNHGRICRNCERAKWWAYS
jgi:hypothetical protein